MRLKDKVAIVTGGGQGIGEGICLAFAREGADIAIPDVNLANAERTSRKVKELGRRAIAIKSDVSKSSDVDRMVEAVVNEWGRIDILVNNAGIRIPGGVLDVTEEEWNEQIAINLTGVFLCTQRAARKMVEKGIKGCIVNISSTAGRIGLPNRAAYCTAKAGVINFARAAAADLGDKGIRVNCIAPGAIATELTAYYTTKFDPSQPDAERMRAIVTNVPLRTWGEVEDIAAAAIYLASDDAKFVTGAILDVDGGFLAGK